MANTRTLKVNYQETKDVLFTFSPLSASEGKRININIIPISLTK